MSVFVDKPIWSYGRMKMCHMIADSEEELHTMADIIGVERKHYQSEARYPHYDISKSKRELAIQNGAIEITSKELILKCKENQEWQ